MMSFSMDYGEARFIHQPETIKMNLRNIFNELLKEFNLSNTTCKFITPTFLDYMKILYKYRDSKNEYGKMSISEYLDSVSTPDFYKYKGSFIHCRYFIYKDRMMFYIVLPIENLQDLCLKLLNNAENHKKFADKVDMTDLIIKFSTMCIKHELGHVIHHKKIIKSKGLQKGFEYIIKQNEKDSIAYNQFNDKTINKIYNSEYDYYVDQLKYYHSLPTEAIANEYGKIDVDLFIKLITIINYGVSAVTNDLIKEINLNE